MSTTAYKALSEPTGDYLVLISTNAPVNQRTSYIVSQVSLQSFELRYFWEDEFYVLRKEREGLTESLQFGTIHEVKAFLKMNEIQG